MFNTEVLNEFFIWEENNLTELKNNCLNNTESVHCDTTTKIKSDSIKKDWRDITDPKLRKKMRKLENNKRYREKHKDKIKSYYESNKETLKEYRTNWKKSNKQRIQEHGKVYRKLNKTKITKNKQSYSKIKYKTDIQYRLKSVLRSRLRMSIKENYKSGSAVSDLGCSISEFKSYIESKFQSGMKWNNWGQYGWHIDHIKPLASFDLTDRKQLLAACHYTNLQPLWWQDNIAKSDN
jgi:hypothetical protein